VAAVRRPRVRTAEGAAEVPVPSYEVFSSTEVLGRMAMERMFAKLSTALPAIFASPDHWFSLPYFGWKGWTVQREPGSRFRSAALRAPGIEPKRRSLSVNSHSMPEMRGEPSVRSVAMVLWRPASKSLRTRVANSGSACSIASRHGRAAYPHLSSYLGVGPSGVEQLEELAGDSRRARPDP